MHWITEGNYFEQMHNIVEPYLTARMESGYDERVAGQPIYYEHYHADRPKGVIVISHGFTESVRKYTGPIYYMLQAGYEVWGLDHRGHGRSFRPGGNPLVVHVEHFDDYVQDLHHLTEKLVKPSSGRLPVFLYCHSMGGCIGAMTIERYPTLFRKAVLSSPMLGMNLGKIPAPAAYALALVKGLKNGGKDPLSPVEAFDPNERYEDSAASVECRFRYYHEKKCRDSALQTCAASTNWVREAIRACNKVCSRRQIAKILVPILLFQAGDDRYVRNASQDIFASRAKSCQLVRMPGLRHELYFSPDSQLQFYWTKIFDFLS